MAKYLCEVSYTIEGTRGLQKDGGSKRRQVVDQLVKASGGTLEAFYFALGESDAILIVDLPDVATATALSMAVAASGAARLKTTVLLTPEQMDQAAAKQVGYTPPGR